MLTTTLKEYIPNETYKEQLKKLYERTILQNPYIPYKPYTKQALPIYLVSKPEEKVEDVIKANEVLAGAGGFGGKTYLGSMLAAQYLPEEFDYTCLVTRKNYAELVDTDSVWENLLDWCCGDHLNEDIKCDYKKSPTPQIEHPNGNKIYFKAFDREDKKQKFKSASYDRIVNDEASELPPAVLRFQYRSIRNTSLIPRSIINLSNPGGESTEYLVEKFVDGDKPYVSLDWRDNPFIDKAAYEGSLNELDYIDQQYQKYGNWHYKPSAGDLITRQELENAIIPVSDFMNYKPLYNAIGIDLAGRGRDRTCCDSLTLFENGTLVCTSITSTESAYPEEMVYRTVEDQYKKFFTNIIDFEREPGGDSIYSLRHWQDELYNLTYKYGILITDKPPVKSKYNRARPVARAIKNGLLKFSSEIPQKILDRLFDQFIYVTPDHEIMKKKKSPDEMDALVYAYNDIQQLTKSGVIVR